MALVAPNTQVRGPDGTVHSAGDLARLFGVPLQGGKVEVPDASIVSTGNKKQVPTPVGVRIPETPLPEGSRQIGGMIASDVMFKTQPINEDGSPITAVTRSDADRTAAQNRQLAASTAMLREMGLDELIPDLDALIRGGGSWEELEVQFYDSASRPGQVVNRIHPWWKQRRDAGNPISIGAGVAYMNQAKSLLRSQGVPSGMWDSPEDLAGFIVKDISLPELQDRVAEYAQFGTQLAADPSRAAELEAFQRFYGVAVNPVEIAALALNPDIALPALKRKTTAVKLDVSAGRAGFGDLSVGEAERLADVGVNEAQAGQGFGFLAQSGELWNPLVGQEASEETISRQEQLSGAFEGDSNAQAKMQRQTRRRTAAFSGGGGFSSDNDGFGGLGSAR